MAIWQFLGTHSHRSPVLGKCSNTKLYLLPLETLLLLRQGLASF